MRALLILVVLAVVGCASPVVAEQSAPVPSSTPTAQPTPTATPTPTMYPCDGRRWEQAQSIIVGPADGIRATIAPTDTALFPCERFGEQAGWSSVFVNLAHYDRRGQEGGELIQLGIIRRTGESATFVYTADNNGGRPIELRAPRPEAGRSYTLSIQLDPSSSDWTLSITDDLGSRTLITEAAHWTDPQSAWVMAEIYDHSLVRNLAVTSLSLSRLGVFSPASFTDCPNIAIAQDGQGGYVTRPTDAFACINSGAILAISSARG